ncbi:MAG: thiol:disulfide interchange protein TlpA, partial [Beijerinckiaceae bacterium]
MMPDALKTIARATLLATALYGMSAKGGNAQSNAVCARTVETATKLKPLAVGEVAAVLVAE